MFGPFGFAAEGLLIHSPPNFPFERTLLTIKLIVAFVFFASLPLLLARKVPHKPSPNNEGQMPMNIPGKSSSNKKDSKTKTKAKSQNSKVQKSSNMVASEEVQEKSLEIHPLANILTACGVIIALPYLIYVSGPDNYYTINAVFQAPLLTKDECNFILKMADEVAETNTKFAISQQNTNETITQLLEDPKGWNKYRHQQYPTTDLNLVTDPFTPAHRDWLKKKLDARLSPILQRIWGIPPSSIRANDMFVVRYDENKRTLLANHTDNGYISINILLDDEFEGGGTRFWNRVTNQPFAYVQPNTAGQVLMHTALLNHEGVHVVKGRRTILVGFLEVDRVNPFVAGLPMTGLSWYASWGSLTWLTTKFNQGHDASHRRMRTGKNHWRNNRYIRSFMGTAQMYLNGFMDRYFEHKVYNLVKDQNRDEFISLLDDTFEENNPDHSNWFQGQQVIVDITGEVVSEMSSRRVNSHRFDNI